MRKSIQNISILIWSTNKEKKLFIGMSSQSLKIDVTFCSIGYGTIKERSMLHIDLIPLKKKNTGWKRERERKRTNNWSVINLWIEAYWIIMMDLFYNSQWVYFCWHISFISFHFSFFFAVFHFYTQLFLYCFCFWLARVSVPLRFCCSIDTTKRRHFFK